MPDRIILSGDEAGEHIRLEWRPKKGCWTLVSFYARSGGQNGHKYEPRDIADISPAAIDLAAQLQRP